VPIAAAAPPAVSVQAVPSSGPAPLHVVLSAGGDAVSYHWDFGDGTAADGANVEHSYAAGRWTATVTARSAGGETATASVTITALGMKLATRGTVRYGRRAVFSGAVVPAARVPVTLSGPAGPIAHGMTRANGSFALRVRVRLPGDYTAAAGGASAAATVKVVPWLRTGLVGSGARGTRYVVAASLRPAGAGTLAVRVTRGGDVLVDRGYTGRARINLDTRRLATYRITVAVTPNDGYVAVRHLLTARVVLPRLTLGARSTSVAQLGARLRELHYAAPFTGSFGYELLDSVYAFQKVQNLPRTGIVDTVVWRRLRDPRIPAPRYRGPADHLEVDKAHQVLYVVRRSHVALIVPVSTAGVPGTYTPVGRFAIYRKVTGFDPSPLGTLYDPMYFTGGYAIHGNPSVPPYPASHGCIRVPMWIAPHLYATNSYGETVYVY
jgi:peptidoglycan hydrolase-like protein with peptidoglycan-binding domain